MLRTVVALVFTGGWAGVVVTIAAKTGDVPPELWTMPALGLGALLAAIRPAGPDGPRRSEEEDA